MRNKNVSVQNNFSKGLITEASGLSFPENACTETYNCTFESLGISRRRLGFDFEDQYATSSIDVEGNVITSFLWNNVAGEGDKSFVVVQVGNTLHFYEVQSDDALSASKHSDTVDLITFAPSGVASVANLECQFASGNGLLFVTHRRLDSFYVEYDVATDNISATEITIKIRDMEGDTADPETVTSRPTSTLAGLNAHHRYNLENQGWTTTTLTSWDTARTDMPSNADVSWYYKNSSDAFDFSTVANKAVGNSPAPKGHFIYNVYDIDRATNVSGATEVEITLERVNTCAFYAGRVFYSGLKTLGQNSKIFFSQVIERKDQYGKCYQDNDPTSDQLFDLLPTDGGVIDIIEAGAILKLVPVLNSLFVYATNGIWMISGSQGIGFAANDYSVQKLSSLTNISHRSFVIAEGIPYWWNLEGIYTVELDKQSNAPRVSSLTDKTIKKFIQDIPVENFQYIKGDYDQYTKRIQWIFRTEDSSTLNDNYSYDAVLIYDLLAQCFYPWTIDVSDVKIHSIVNVFGFSGVAELTQVVNGANTVVNGSDNVVVFLTGNSGVTSIIKFLVSYDDSGTNKITFAECFKTSRLDWESFDDVGVSYESYFVTGFVIRGQGIRKYQTNYVQVLSESLEDSSFGIRGLWDYSTASSAGRWTNLQTFEIDAGQYAYVPKKIKIRGQGTACQFKISNNGTDPFNIAGWSIAETGNQWI